MTRDRRYQTIAAAQTQQPSAMLRTRAAIGRIGLLLPLLTSIVAGAIHQPSASHAAPAGLATADWQAIQAMLPPSQQAYLKASNTAIDDSFGVSVAASGNTVVVGAHQEASAATGVNGDQTDNSAEEAGAAYVFTRTDDTWSQQAYLKASNTEAGDLFGWSVAIDGNTIVVGAGYEDSGSSGVNSTPNEAAPWSGAAYVFTRTNDTWSQQAYLKASNTGASDRFGLHVAVDDDIIVVGANREDSSATGVNGDQGDNSASAAGAAYVFARNGTTWTQQSYLKASNAEAGDLFGESVTVAGDTVVVGAIYEASKAAGVNGNQNDNWAFRAGAAYVFTRTNDTWSQQAYLKASNTWQAYEFGVSMAMDGDTLVVGSAYESNVFGSQTGNGASASGAAYVFTRNGTTWSQQAYLKASNADANDRFGTSVALRGNSIVIGAPGEASAATGVDGNPADNSAALSGAAYMFTRSGTTWNQHAYMKASTTNVGDIFGWKVALADDTIVVGAPGEASAATGVNGDQTDNSAAGAGAVTVFSMGNDLPTPTTTPTTTITPTPTTTPTTTIPTNPTATTIPIDAGIRIYLPLTISSLSEGQSAP